MKERFKLTFSLRHELQTTMAGQVGAGWHPDGILRGVGNPARQLNTGFEERLLSRPPHGLLGANKGPIAALNVHRLRFDPLRN